MDVKLVIIVLLLVVSVAGYIRLYRHYRRNIKKVIFLFDAIDNVDFSFNFPMQGVSKNDRILHQSSTASRLSCNIPGRSRWSVRNITRRY